MGASEFRNYPFLNGEEFIEVCHLLDRRYCQTSIGNKRRRWRLDVIRALNVSFSLGPEYNTYLSIIDSIVREPEDGGLSSCLETLSFRGIPSTNDDGLSSSLQALSFQGRQTTDVDMDDDTEMIASEKADEPFVMSGNPTPDPSSETVIGKVKYDIILHPTYQVPCLWFALSGLTTGENPLDIEAVFRYLVPEEYKSRLRSAGPIGGISMDHHPITGLPAFFIHPCMVGEAMSEFDCSKETYLIVWIGLVGACVGLNVPSEMMLEQSEVKKRGHSL